MGHRYTVNGTILPYEVVEDVRSAFDRSQKQFPSEEFGEDVESVKDRAYRHFSSLTSQRAR
jgi:hypothetical protein